MKNNRRKFTPRFKSKVVLEAISERETLKGLALKYDLHRNQIADWKKKFIANAHLVFELEENQSLETKQTGNDGEESKNENIYSPVSHLMNSSNDK